MGTNCRWSKNPQQQNSSITLAGEPGEPKESGGWIWLDDAGGWKLSNRLREQFGIGVWRKLNSRRMQKDQKAIQERTEIR